MCRGGNNLPAVDERFIDDVLLTNCQMFSYRPVFFKFCSQSLSLALLSHRQMKQEYFFFFFTIFCKATCWPSKKLTISRSTQIINSCSLFLRSSKTATTFAKHFEWNDDTQYTMNTVALEQTGWNDYTHEGNHFIKKNDNKSTFSFLKCYI